MRPLIHINRRGGAAVRFPNGPRDAVYPALADLDGHPRYRRCVFAVQSRSVLAGRGDSLRVVCVRARCVPASHQNESTARLESGNSLDETSEERKQAGRRLFSEIRLIKLHWRVADISRKIALRHGADLKLRLCLIGNGSS
jgi:hypothetical protein